MPSVTTLSPLTVTDLRRILTEVKGSLASQYTALFAYSGVEIKFTDAALYAICRKAVERGGGARGLRGLMVSTFLLDLLFAISNEISSGIYPLGFNVRSTVSSSRCHVGSCH